MVLVVKNLLLMREMWFPGLGRSLGGRHSNPLQDSRLENPRDRGTLWATVHRVAKSWTQLKRLSTHTHVCVCVCLCRTAKECAVLSCSVVSDSLQPYGLPPLSMGFSRHEYWSGLLWPWPGILPNPGVKPSPIISTALGERVLYN